MKKTLLILILAMTGWRCGKPAVEKPNNLIDRDKMVNIIYDLSLLDAIKSQQPVYLEENSINPRTYIYKKYKIDSLQFVESNKYYASDLDEYKKIYADVAKRIESGQKKKTGKKANPDTPQIQ